VTDTALDQLLDDAGPESSLLMFGMHGDISEVGAVEPISERPAGTDEHAVHIDEALEPACSEDRP
jgi:hypothetical protein